MSRRRWTYGAAVAVVVVLAVVAALALPGRLADRDRSLVAAAWLPVWDERSAASLRPALDVGGVTEVSPTWATVGLDGELVVTPPPAEVLDRLDEAGARLLPTVQNYADGNWQGQLIADLLGDPERADAHREALVGLALADGWDGIDIDYEAPAPDGRAAVHRLPHRARCRPGRARPRAHRRRAGPGRTTTIRGPWRTATSCWGRSPTRCG